jgi:pimeloyl-ACP methyl ester carboxylesterase
MELLGSLAMAAGMGVMLRRAILETGMRRYDPACHRLYCRREGTGPPVVLLHGLAGSWRYWRRGLDGLTQRHTLYVADLLGFGRSPKPRGDYSIAMHVDALTGLVDEIEGDIVIAGHSMGAILALAVYARRPARVSRIVLIGLPYFPAREAARASLARQSLMNRMTLEWSWMAQGMCYMKDFFALPVFAPLARMPVDLYRDYWKHTWNSVSRSIFNTLLAADVVGLMREVERARITLVHGRADSVAPIEHIRQLVAQFPEVRLREINSGHHLYLVYPRLLNRIIAEEGKQLTCDS